MSWDYFKLEEFACKHCGENKIDHALVDLLDIMRARLGVPLVVSSGYRCPEHNQAVSSTGKNGPHTTGRAVDLAVRGCEALQVMREALLMGFTGIGVNQKGSSRFIHLDRLEDSPSSPRPWVWSY